MKKVLGTSLENAIELFKVVVASITIEKETLPIGRALGRVLADDCTAKVDTPAFDRSPLDGYAICGEDSVGATKESPVVLTVLEKICAGQVPTQNVVAGTAVRIMTGAMMPKGANSVIRQEDTDYGTEKVELYAEVAPYQNFIRQGEDTKLGTVFLKEGHCLTALELAVCSSVGVHEVVVYRQPQIAILSTGDELVPLGTPLPAGKIYDSNLQFLTARLKEMGLPEPHQEFLEDDAEEASKRFLELSKEMDLIITTGGASVGEKDLMPTLSEQIGSKLLFWGLKLKPGSPALGWMIGDTPVLSLSGNPFAATATFELLGRPLLHWLSKGSVPLSQRGTAILANDFPKASGGRRFIRGRVEEGELFLPDKHSSGVLASMIGCNCLVDIPAGTPTLKRGDEVNFLYL